ncbi:hypothetical protein IU486_26880 [Streptomyces gardneri]|uniref:hypothetical protein n=1 Tax=Nocardia TaxID=1817 RepID=UPI00135CDC28|nr:MULTISPECIES: hypothetical protein [Nocardia]MBF6168348.1 hypothetical protein [Streptomyces gardneri]MBF6205842.1 hypothetical protein [Streptomyces gardneri]
MPKRISDVSLHVYVTPETLERVVDTVRAVVDDHLTDRDVFAWRFTLPVDIDDPAHTALAGRCPAAVPGALADDRGTYEIALSLVGAPDQLTGDHMAALERQLLHAISGLARTEPGDEIPVSIRASQRTDVDLDIDRDLELL